MQAILRFPDCVDPNKITDYAYAAANNGKCPPNMKRMPSLRFSIRYDTRKAIPQGWKGVPPFKLACGEVRIRLPPDSSLAFIFFFLLTRCAFILLIQT